MDEKLICPIAYIRTDFKEKFGIPRQSGRVESVTGEIIFTQEYRNSESLSGIREFSHLWLIFGFSAIKSDEWHPTVRPPRLGGNKRMGVFASRSTHRPNGLGLSSVKLIDVINTKDEGTVLVVSGADLMDNTPIYDIKPYIKFSDCHVDAVSGYADENNDYHLKVIIPEDLKSCISPQKLEAIIGCLADDPRPSYQDDTERIYGMRFAEYNVRFKVSGSVLTVVSVEIIQT